MPIEVQVSLSEPGQAEFDKELLGYWYAMDENGDTIMIVSAREQNDGQIRGDYLMLENNGVYGGAARIRGQIFASEIDGQRYYNIQRLEDNLSEEEGRTGESDSYIIAKLKADDDGVLSIKALGGDHLEEMVESGQLKYREVKGDPYGDYVVLELTRNELIELVRKHPGDKLFEFFEGQDIKVVFKRLEHTYPDL